MVGGCWRGVFRGSPVVVFRAFFVFGFVPLLLFCFSIFFTRTSCLPPIARTLLGGLGHAALKFLVVAARLFLAFCVRPKFTTSPNSGVKFFGGFLRSEKRFLCLFLLAVRLFLGFVFPAAIARFQVAHLYLHQLLFLPRRRPNTADTCMPHILEAGAHTTPHSRTHLPPKRGQDREAFPDGPHSIWPPQCNRGGAAPRLAVCRTTKIAEWQCWPRTADTSPGTPRDCRTCRAVLASMVTAVTMGPLAMWPRHLLPPVPHQEAPPSRPAAPHTPIAPLTAEQL